MACRCGDTCVMVPTCEEEQDFDCSIGNHDLGPLEHDSDGDYRRCRNCFVIWDEDEDDWIDDVVTPPAGGGS